MELKGQRNSGMNLVVVYVNFLITLTFLNLHNYLILYITINYIAGLPKVLKEPKVCFKG